MDCKENVSLIEIIILSKRIIRMSFVYEMARIIRKIMPYGLYCRIVGDSYSKEIAKMKKDIWNNKELNKLYKPEIDYMKGQGRLCSFPYRFQEKYKGLKTNVYCDADGWNYVIHQGKKLFFPIKWSIPKIRSYYNGLITEQDSQSPHCYFTNSFSLTKGGIFVDVGCAEAMTSLECVDVASYVYLFECDQEWYEALDKTFAPYSNKVCMIHKFVSDISEGNFIRLDDVLNIENLHNQECMIKMDLEGNESNALKGAEKLLQYDNLKLACCLYHKKEDEKELIEILIKSGFKVEVSDGYMLQYYQEGLAYPYFRKVLARAVK